MTSKRTARQQTCRFWDCTERVRQFMCGEHYRSYKKGEIDACPSCKRFKLAKYDTCMDCRKGSGKAAPKAQGGTGGAKRGSKRYRREHSDAWASGDAEASEFYVYILKLEDGSFYAGQTREIRERLMEHRDGMTKSTAGKDPKLVWFTTVTTREQATDYEVQVKRVCDGNPREIRRWIRRFQDLVEELELE